MKIVKIKATETTNLRSNQLRQGLPLSTCVFDRDENEDTFHLGLKIENEIVSIASFFNNNHQLIDYSDRQYQLRGMATAESYKGKGAGSKLINYVSSVLKGQNIDVLWCNARLNAVKFYQKNGFEIISDEFQIEGVGPHLVMKLDLKTN